MPPAQRKPYFDVVLSFPVVLAAALAAFVLIIVPRSVADPDIWWHLRNAQILASTHTFITRDTFSFTALGAPWMNHEWIAELPFYLGWTVAGARGVYWAMVLAIEAITLSVFFLSYRRSANAGGALLVTVVAIFLSSVSFGPRTLLFGWLCLLAELLLLHESQRRPKLAWLLPVLFALWVNTHGSWLIGIVVLFVYIATSAVRFQWGAIYSEGLDRQQLRSLLPGSFLSFLVLFLNPYGWRLVAYPFNLAFHQKLNIANVDEWKPVDFHSPRGRILLLSLAALALWQLYKRRRWELRDLALLAIGLYSALSYSRFLFLFSILAAPIIASRFPRRQMAEGSTRPLVNGALIVAMLLCTIKQFRAPDVASQKAMPMYPVDALPFLSTFHPQGRVFNEYLWGGFLIWNVRDQPVFIDSRVDIFEYNGTFKDYLDIIHINRSLELLDHYNVRYVLYETDTPLVYLLEHSGGWKVDYAQGSVVLLERTNWQADPRG